MRVWFLTSFFLVMDWYKKCKGQSHFVWPIDFIFYKALVFFFFFFFLPLPFWEASSLPSFLEEQEVSWIHSLDKSSAETCQINNSFGSTNDFVGCSSPVSSDVAEQRELLLHCSLPLRAVTCCPVSLNTPLACSSFDSPYLASLSQDSFVLPSSPCCK